MENKYKSLTGTAALFTGANILSKLIKILIVPFYTYYMTTAEFGTAETLQVTVSLLGPVFLLGANEAAIRFTMKDEYIPAEILSNCVALLTITCLPGIILCFPMIRFAVFRDNWWMLILLVILSAAESLLVSFTKGIGRKKVFAVSELVSAASLVLFSFILMGGLRAGLKGYLLSLAFASVSRMLYISLKIHVSGYISIKRVDRKLLISILKFSLPIMPGVILWWVMNSSGRYAVLWFLGPSSVGIYAIACRLSAIVISLSAVFHQAWQLSAIKQYEKQGFETFYAGVFGAYRTVTFLAAAILIALSKPVMLLLDDSYRDAWRYAPFMLLSAVFLGLSGFVYINYTLCEKTMGVFTTSLAGALVCVGMSMVLTPRMGIQGAAVASFASFYFLWLIMSIHTGRLLGIRNEFMSVHSDLALVLAESVLLLKGYSYIFTVLCLLVLILINRKKISALISGAAAFAGGLRKE